ncbi:hypothetical protein E4U24_007254 [Claviceps purpurea]|nr:hypothetical protein E4U12_000222 [Claviceps purpurea]KAG6238093.1 hypothetical protein E4U24_007254 [Claviceps purpurea]KAG6251303.1 hypothetical protein E4U23_000790 [Claviceps purpurea]KAG6305120.1 hypothetical protein E4U45_000670 [Claviceps purpurea]KAG6311835.1 hypothetical protein E4U44_003842 [Claviceps purpurea]
MNSISNPSQTAQTSASAGVERGLIDYLPLVDHLQQSNNLSAVQNDAQYAQMETRLDVFENILTDVGGTMTGIRDDVRGIRGDVQGIRDNVKGMRDDVKAIRSHFSNIQQAMTRTQGDVRGFINDIRVLREDLGREMDSMCVMVLNADSPSKKSGQDPAKVNIRLKTS